MKEFVYQVRFYTDAEVTIEAETEDEAFKKMKRIDEDADEVYVYGGGILEYSFTEEKEVKD